MVCQKRVENDTNLSGNIDQKEGGRGIEFWIDFQEKQIFTLILILFINP